MKKKFVLIALICALGVLALILCCCKVKKTDKVYTVKYYVDGELYSEEQYNYGSALQTLSFEDNEDEDKYFIGWCTSQSYTDFSTANVITGNLSLYGYWTTYEDSRVIVTYYDEGEVVEEREYKKGTLIENITLPDRDDGYSFNQWLVDEVPYNFETRISADLQLCSSWKPTEFTVEFLSLGECIATCTYTVEDRSIDEPECPDREHYKSGGCWEDYELTVGNVQVNAVYEPVVYTVNYIGSKNELVESIEYTVLTYKEITPPSPPVVSGCLCYWDDLVCGETSLRLKVEFLDYTIDYGIEDQVIATFNHTILTYHELVEPDIPDKTGYTCHWEEYNLREETHITVNPVYETITYYVNFVVDGQTIDVADYTIEETDVELPDIPQKDGYYSDWEDFELTYGDVTVLAEYTPIDYYAHFTIFDELTGYSERLTYTSSFNIENFSITNPSQSDFKYLAGCSVNWDKPVFGLHDIEINGYYYDSDYTYLKFVQVIVYDGEDEIEGDDNEVEDSDEEVKEENIRNVVDRYFYVSGAYNYVDNAVIPGTYHGYPVKYIEEKAFLYGTFKTLVIDGVEEIRDNAFQYCTDLESLTINDGVKIIGARAFSSCVVLQNLSLSDTITEIQFEAFVACGIVTLTVPRGISVLSEGAFDSCVNLEKVIMYDNVVEIGANAFQGCRNLTECILGKNVEIIRDSAFAYCTALTEFTITESVNFIECNAFSNCISLTDVYIVDTQSAWYFYGSDESLNLIPKSLLTDSCQMADCLKILTQSNFIKRTV